MGGEGGGQHRLGLCYKRSLPRLSMGNMKMPEREELRAADKLRLTNEGEDK